MPFNLYEVANFLLQMILQYQKPYGLFVFPKPAEVSFGFEYVKELS